MVEKGGVGNNFPTSAYTFSYIAVMPMNKWI